MKLSRHSKILELISNFDIETQEELAERLLRAGFSVTQATISRDIRELKLGKMPTEGGKQKYAVLKNPDLGLSEKYVRVLRDAFVSMDTAQNIVVLKTVSGMAMAVAAALDSLELEGVMGCIAGDDTIMCVVKTNMEAERVIGRISKLV